MPLCGKITYFIVNLQYISVVTTILWYIYLTSIYHIYLFWLHVSTLMSHLQALNSRTIVHIVLQFLSYSFCLTVFVLVLAIV